MEPGDLVAGRFRLDRRVGSRGMGLVFRAQDEAICAASETRGQIG